MSLRRKKWRKKITHRNVRYGNALEWNIFEMLPDVRWFRDKLLQKANKGMSKWDRKKKKKREEEINTHRRDSSIPCYSQSKYTRTFPIFFLLIHADLEKFNTHFFLAASY